MQPLCQAEARLNVVSDAPMVGREGREDDLASADRDLRNSFTGGRGDRVREG